MLATLIESSFPHFYISVGSLHASVRSQFMKYEVSLNRNRSRTLILNLFRDSTIHFWTFLKEICSLNHLLIMIKKYIKHYCTEKQISSGMLDKSSSQKFEKHLQRWAEWRHWAIQEYLQERCCVVIKKEREKPPDDTRCQYPRYKKLQFLAWPLGGSKSDNISINSHVEMAIFEEEINI